MNIPQTQTIEEIAAQAFAGKVLIVKNHRTGVHLLWAKDDVIFAQTAKSVFKDQRSSNGNTAFGYLVDVKRRVTSATILHVLPTYALACLYLRKRVKTTGISAIDEALKEQGVL